MQRMESHVLKFLRTRLKTDDEWSSLQVVFSGSSEPGEGEHKIVQALRRRKYSSRYKPDTVRVVFGQDADLILLAFATHGPRMYVLRERWGASEKVLDAFTRSQQNAPQSWTPADMLELDY